MKYEFHVGDYVETTGGFVGWICRMRGDGYIWVANKDVAFCAYRMPEELEYFNRIGQYDFTKKDKIEHLSYDGSPDWDDNILIDKINELIDAVNELREAKNDKPIS